MKGRETDRHRDTDCQMEMGIEIEKEKEGKREKLIQINKEKRNVTIFMSVSFSQVVWTVRYVDIRGHLIDAAAFILEHGDTIVSQTSIQASQKYVLCFFSSFVSLGLNC